MKNLFVVGELASKTAVYSAQIFSYYNIPFCGSDEASPELSDKNRFSYFFRMTQGRGYGNYLLQFLKYYNVKRVAIVVAPDHLSTYGGKAVENALQAAGITILTKITLNPIVINAGDFSIYYNTLVLAASNILSDFIMAYDSPDLNSPPVQQFKTAWSLVNDLFLAELNFTVNEVMFYTGAYDCVKLIMKGIHNFLESDSKYTPEMLANGSLNKYLTPDKFANTGYEGVTSLRLR
ncbi:hypothetical protein HDU76_013813 [Blyttiomyces sp. JEL0837]|nr:hypothetical protein HDU76_013813 [Blyttiomyces sp. JEL0837]